MVRNARRWATVVVFALVGCSESDGSVPAIGGAGAAGTGGGAGASGQGGAAGATAGQGGSPAGGAGSPQAGGAGAGGSAGGACQPVTPSADWFVAPGGTKTGAGTLAEPLDLATAIGQGSPVKPGNRVVLLAGTYAGRFVSRLAGQSGSPIVLFAQPGARVTLDSAQGSGEEGLSIEGPWVEFHGLEVTSSDGGRVSQQTGSSPGDISLAGGVSITAPNVKLVNCVIHDTAQGVSFWSNAVDSELYGNIIYNNGWSAPDRGHGHAIYTQNATGTKRIARNVLFFGFSFGLHAYTEGGSIQGFDIEDNVWFRTGASVPGQDGLKDGCLVGGLQPVARTRLSGNTSWAPGVTERGVQLGYGSSVENEDVTLTDNYLVGRLGANGSWKKGILTGNTVHGELVGINPSDYPDNSFSSALPQGQKVIVRGNHYDPGRAEVIAYDWAAGGKVDVDLSTVVPQGVHFELFSVFDLWGQPLASGVYQGGTVSVPLGTRPGPDPVGLAGAIAGNDDPGARFGVFVVRRDVCAEP